MMKTCALLVSTVILEKPVPSSLSMFQLDWSTTVSTTEPETLVRRTTDNVVPDRRKKSPLSLLKSPTSRVMPAAPVPSTLVIMISCDFPGW